MDNKRCEDILLYMDDVLDGHADETEKTAFDNHIAHCDKCRTKYEIYCKIKTLLETDLPEPSDTLQEDIERQLDALTPVAVQTTLKKKSLLFYAIIAVCSLAFLAALLILVFSFVGSTKTEEDDVHIHLNDQGEVQKLTLDEDSGTDLIIDEFFPLLHISDIYYKSTPYTFGELLTVFSSVDLVFNHTYGGMLFVMASSFDDVNRAEDVSYYEGTGNGNVAFFSCKMTFEEFSSRFTSVYEEYFISSGIECDTILLVVCLT